MDNRDIEELASLINLFDTPVIVSSEIKMVPPESLENVRQKLMSIIENWRVSWQDKDIDQYMSLYSRRFTSGWRNWNQWKEYKTRLAKKYKSIKVEVDELGLLAHKGVILATFKQKYSTPSFESYGKKILYITQNSAEWRIIGETFRDEKRPKFAARLPKPFDIKEIEAFIYEWKNAWENKELERYISYYDKNFKSRGMDLRRWKKHRNRVNMNNATIQVDIRNMKIKSVSNESASVSFKQHYRADSYRDEGIKKILLVRKGKDWKIRTEEWTPIREKSRP
jgi:murein L,D-transpeptidase YafK